MISILDVSTPDGHSWKVVSIIYSRRPSECLALAVRDDGTTRGLATSTPVEALTAESLTRAIETAAAFDPERFDSWLVRPRNRLIAPWARNFTPGVDVLTGTGQPRVGGRVILKIVDGTDVILRVEGDLGAGVFAGRVESAEGRSERLLLEWKERLTAFHERNVFVADDETPSV